MKAEPTRTEPRCPTCDGTESVRPGCQSCSDEFHHGPRETQERMKAERSDLTPFERDALAALSEAAALLDTASSHGYVSDGWREDAQLWRGCWADLLGIESQSGDSR
jgi:hypothetical protein